MILPTDHIDLLVTAMRDWHLVQRAGLDEQSAAALVGASLRGANIAAQQALARAGRLDPAEVVRLSQVPAGYVFTPVEAPYEPVDVLKAAHSAMAECALAPQWAGSRLRDALDALAAAAAQRMPGYDTAAWVWERPERITRAVGFAGGHMPLGVPGLVWVDAATLQECWDSAVAVVVAAEALDELDVSLPSRRNVYVLVDGALSEEQWTVLGGLGAVQVVDQQQALGWLVGVLEQLDKYVPTTSG